MRFFRKKQEQSYFLGQELPVGQMDRYRFLDDTTVSILKTGRIRMLILASLFTLAFLIVLGRLFQQTILRRTLVFSPSFVLDSPYIPVSRADITDRNGVVLATSLPTVDLYVDASQITNPEQMTKDILRVFPDLNPKELLE